MAAEKSQLTDERIATLDQAHRTLFFAYVMACGASGLAAMPLYTGIYGWPVPPRGELLPHLAVSYFALSLFAAAGTAFWFMLIGMPVHALLRARNARSIVWYACNGLFVGIVPTALGALFQKAFTGQIDYVYHAQFGKLAVALGIVASLTFWLIRRPERDATSQPENAPL